MRKLLNKLDVWLAKRTKCYKSLQKSYTQVCQNKERLKENIKYLAGEREELSIDRLYLGGLQRDFTKELTPPEKQYRAVASISFVKDACESIFNEILKEHSEALFRYGENEEFRNMAHNNINVVLKVERKIKEFAHIDKPDDDFDPNDPL